MNGTYKKSDDQSEGSGSNLAQSLAETASEGGAAAMEKAGEVVDAGKRKLDALKDSASEAMDEGRSRLKEAKDAIVGGAGSTLAAVKDVAVEKADTARETLSDVGERLAATLQRSADDEDDDALKSKVLSSVAQGLTQASDVLRQRSVSDLAADVREMARRHPGAFMAGAAVLGFAAARFVRSSARRRTAEDDREQGPRV